MVKVEPRWSRQTKKLPLFSIDAAKFLEVVSEKFSTDMPISAKIGDWDSPSKTILEDRDELLSHLALLNNSFEISVGDLKIEIGKTDNRITFEEPQRVAAEAILADLDHYVPIFSRAVMLLSTNKAFVISGFAFLYAIVRSEASFEKLGLLSPIESNLIFIVAMLPLIARNLSLWVRPRVYYKLNDNFLRRNKDKIIWGLMAYLAGNMTPNFVVIKDFIFKTFGLIEP